MKYYDVIFGTKARGVSHPIDKTHSLYNLFLILLLLLIFILLLSVVAMLPKARVFATHFWLMAICLIDGILSIYDHCNIQVLSIVADCTEKMNNEGRLKAQD